MQINVDNDSDELEEDLSEEGQKDIICKDQKVRLQLPALQRTQTQNLKNESMQRRYINESLYSLIDEGTYPTCLKCFIDFDEKWMMPIFKRAFK